MLTFDTPKRSPASSLDLTDRTATAVTDDGDGIAALNVAVVAARAIERVSIIEILHAAGLRRVQARAVPTPEFDVVLAREGREVNGRRMGAALPPRGHRRTKLIVLCDTPARMLEAVAAGADGAMPSAAGVTELLDAIRSVALGALAIPTWVLDRLVDGTGLIALDGIEDVVLAELSVGATDRDISTRHHLGRTVIRDTIASLRRKLDANDRLHVVIRAHELGLLT